MAEDFQTSIEIQTQILDRIPRPLADSFRYVAIHLKFRHQKRSSNLLMYIDKINFFLPNQYKIQNSMKPLDGVLSLQPRPRISTNADSNPRQDIKILC